MTLHEPLKKWLPELNSIQIQAVRDYAKEQARLELERLLAKQYFAEGYGYDHGQVVDVLEIEDRIKELKEEV